MCQFLAKIVEDHGCWVQWSTVDTKVDSCNPLSQHSYLSSSETFLIFIDEEVAFAL